MVSFTEFTEKSKKRMFLKKIKIVSIFLGVVFVLAFLINGISNINNQVLFADVSLASINIFLLCVMALFILIAGFKFIHEIYLLKITSKNASLLIDLSHEFQSCSSGQKIAHILAEFLEKMIDKSRGVIYLMHPDYNYLEAIAIWGKLISYEKKIYPINDSFFENKSSDEINVQSGLMSARIEQEEKEILIICQSIVNEKKLLGFIRMECKKKNKMIDAQKKKIILTIAKSAALALANLKLRELLQSKSTHDPLTGLYNRHYLNEYLDTQLSLALRQKKNLAVLMFDIDHFKEFNDDYGHDAGDLLLMAMGALLQEEARMSDAICRFGGEEFIWILYDCTLKAAKSRAELLRNKILKLSINYKNKRYRAVSISLGIACFPDNGTDSNELIKAADQALYYAKRTGRNKVVSYSEMHRV